ncbi:E3 ubiquitin-protein ligase TRIM39-like isoform X2 [Erythrolamprus reginae]|uniref:E3 ubiquitin-protein ligase TRIM39-like isoform X2 n=1 Tax=Erythrolamprus reginae TaxID=121349 RepID=UPI00396C4301
MSQEIITVKTFSAEVTCSICLEYFREPVMLRCGHNFCYECIMKYWREFALKYTCPRCKTNTETVGALPNKCLETFVRLLGQLKQEAEGKEACDKPQVPWKYFCRGHQALFCKLCAGSSDHEGHVKIPLEQATKEFKDFFREFLIHIENQKSIILGHKASIEKESQDAIKATENFKKEMRDMFEGLRRFLNIEEFTQIRKISEIEKHISQIREERMDELFQELSFYDKMVRDLQKKCGQEGNDLLQDISSTLERCKKKEILQHLKLFPLNNKWEIWNIWDAIIFLKNAIHHFQAVITFDKETAHPLLIVSEDCKSVSLGDKIQLFPKTRKRFDTSHIVLGCEEFIGGRNYWDISVGNEGEWTVGVARKSVRRKNSIAIEPHSGIWAIGKRANEYFAFNSPNCSRLQPNRELRKIRIFLNYPGKHVSFFDADEAKLLHHTSTNTVSKEGFVPFFHLSHKAVLTLTP